MPPAPPLAPPAVRRAPFAPILPPQGACTSPYGSISGNQQLSRFNEYIIVRIGICGSDAGAA